MISFYLDQHLTERALLLAKQIQRGNPSHFHANLILAKTLFQVRSNVELIEQVLRQCIQSNPRHLESHYLLARVLSDRGDYDQALEV